MAQQSSQDSAVELDCLCGQRLKLEPGLLGRLMHCPHCGRLLRVALQFLLVSEERARNLTALCACGRLIVTGKEMSGRAVTCRACGRRVVMPRPVVRPGAGEVLRISPQALQRQMNRMRGRLRRGRPPGAGMTVAGPGQRACVNTACGYPLARAANVCPRCGTNQTTGVCYVGRGPERDPKGRWKRPPRAERAR